MASPASESPLAAKVRAALKLREPLEKESTAYRLINGESDGLDGLRAERYEAFVVLSVFTDEMDAAASEVAELLVGLGYAGVYLKRRVRVDLRRVDVSDLAPGRPIAGVEAPTPLVISENGLRMKVLMNDGMATGLYVDQRNNRALLRGDCDGARVLNLFSYTGAFTVAAGLGGARETVSIDLSRRTLERSRENVVLNGLEPKEHKHYAEDALKWTGRAVRKEQRFDWIVLDPPSFATRGRQVFTIARGYPQMAERALRLLEPGGRLLAVTNHTKTDLLAFESLLQEVADKAGRSVADVVRLGAPLDCRARPGVPEPVKSMLVTAT
ncbi:MAG: class I SAM-dependent rRNA methyltransferase [Polyangiaceae bacterium]|nr:class I SAM-dependent rRNA methyltransferase [Polyangiaceae bacterium]